MKLHDAIALSPTKQAVAINGLKAVMAWGDVSIGRWLHGEKVNVCTTERWKQLSADRQFELDALNWAPVGGDEYCHHCDCAGCRGMRGYGSRS